MWFKHILDGAAILVEVSAGLLAGLMLISLFPGDSLDTDVVGALVVGTLAAVASLAAHHYRKTLNV